MAEKEELVTLAEKEGLVVLVALGQEMVKGETLRRQGKSHLTGCCTHHCTCPLASLWLDLPESDLDMPSPLLWLTFTYYRTSGASLPTEVVHVPKK